MAMKTDAARSCTVSTPDGPFTIVSGHGGADGVADGIVEEAPVPVVPVPVPNQGVYDEHIPKAVQQLSGVYGRLCRNRMEDVGQFGAIPVAL